MAKRINHEKGKRIAAEDKSSTILAQEESNRVASQIMLKDEKLKREAAEKKSELAVGLLKDAQHELFREKKVSRGMNEKAKEEAADMMEEARTMMEEASNARVAVFETNKQMDDACNRKVRDERLQSSVKRRSYEQKAKVKLDLELRGHEAIIQHLNEKHEKEKRRLKQCVSDMHEELLEKTKQHTNKLDEANTKMLDEKRKSRKLTQEKASTKALMVEEVLYLEGWLKDMAEEVKDAKRETKQALKDRKEALEANEFITSVSSKRLALLKDLKIRVNELRDDLADESHQRAALERLSSIKLEIKRERAIGRKGGSDRWPVRIVLLICELLVNGTPPSAVPKNIRTFSSTITGDAPSQSPSVSFVRQCRVVVQNLNEMLAAYRFSKEERWHQLFTDGTTRRQVVFQNLVIGISNGDKFESIIASSCIYLEDETSETQVEALKNKVSIDCFVFE